MSLDPRFWKLQALLSWLHWFWACSKAIHHSRGCFLPHDARKTEREEATDFLQSPPRANLNSVRSFIRPHLLKVTVLTMTYGAMVTRDLKCSYSEYHIVHPVSLSSMKLWYHLVWQSHYDPTCSPRSFSLPVTFCPLWATASHTYHLCCSSLLPPVQRPVLYHRPLLCDPSPRSGEKTGGKELLSSRIYLFFKKSKQTMVRLGRCHWVKLSLYRHTASAAII